jgi:DNA-binding MarR family transcriptional regulator
MIISRNKSASQKELADILEISTTAVAVSLKKLENGGYVKKVVDSNDNRFNKIDLTEKGLEVVKLSHEIFYSIDKSMFEGFTDEEKNNMLNYLDKMYSNLARMESDFKNEGEEK